MENEENRGLINKKASKDQCTDFCQFSYGDLFLFSLLSHTLAHLENSWSTLALENGMERKDKKEKERKDQERKIQIKWIQHDYLQLSSFMYGFLAIFGMHGTDPNLNKDEKLYIYNHKYKDAAEITLHFINIKY